MSRRGSQKSKSRDRGHRSPSGSQAENEAGSSSLARLEANFKHGSATVPHGYVRKINSNGDVDLFSCFVHGHQHGPAWKGLMGGR